MQAITENVGLRLLAFAPSAWIVAGSGCMAWVSLLHRPLTNVFHDQWKVTPHAPYTTIIPFPPSLNIRLGHKALPTAGTACTGLRAV
jgi:hypothetical protein